MLLTIGKVAGILGLHPDTIRRYEREGLIPEAKRSPMNGYRIWTAADVELIREAIFGLDSNSAIVVHDSCLPQEGLTDG